MEEAAGTAEGAGEADGVTDMESWYQLQAEEDASNFMPTLSELGPLAEQTEFPTVEEGTLHSEPDEDKGHVFGQVHSLQFDTQDSRLSPCLPLLASASTQGHKFFDDTLYQQTETDFAPLSPCLDMSEFPGHSTKSLLIGDAVALAGREISLDTAGRSFNQTQHILPNIEERSHDMTSFHYLSQHPLPSSEQEADVVQSPHNDPEGANLEFGVLQAGAPMEQTGSSLKNLDKVFSQGDGSFLDSSVSAPALLDLLEKEVGVSGSSEVSSRSSSIGNINAGPSDELQAVHSEQPLFSVSGTHVPSDAEIKSEEYPVEGEAFHVSGEVDSKKELDPEDSRKLNISHHVGVSLTPAKEKSPQTLKDELRRQLFLEIKQRYRQKLISKSKQNQNDKEAMIKPSFLTKDFPEADMEKDRTAVEHQAGVSPDELTMSSRCSIERGHKDTEISPVANPPAEDMSFIGRLPQPISQSTPGTFTVKNARNQLSGRIMQIKAKLTGSLTEEPPDFPSKTSVSAKPSSLQSSHTESNDSRRSFSPDRRRIHSLPSLNYIEKVGAWNTNQSYDALVLRGLSGESPKKKAYNAVADSLNRMLSQQSGGALPNRGLSATLSGTGSMNNLNAKDTETTNIPQLVRSQSCNIVPMGDSGEAAIDTQDSAVIKPREEGADMVEKEEDQQDMTEVMEKPIVVSRPSSTFSVDSDLKLKPLDQNNIMGQTETEQLLQCNKIIDKQGGEQEASDGLICKLSGGPCNVKMDCFSDVSLDNEYLSSSCSSDRINLMHSLASLDHFVPFWPSSINTPEGKEINIEERIPTYLRNLGIDQSPSSILTPFAPKGPIREPEFSPSELRTIKGSTATPNRSMHLSEGGSQSVINISQSSLYSTASTTSVSIPMGSDHGHESPLPSERSPQLSSESTEERPLSQCDLSPQQAEEDVAHQPVQTSEEIAAGTVAEEEQSLGKYVQSSTPTDLQTQEENLKDETSNKVKLLVDHFEYKNISLGLKQSEIQAVESLVQKKPSGSVNDSFVGSKTLKEIRKLLSEADNIGLNESGCSFPITSQLKDISGSSSPVLLKLEDSYPPGDVSEFANTEGGLSSQILWDGSLHTTQSDSLLYKDPSEAVGWDDSRTDPNKDTSYLETDIDEEHKSGTLIPFQKLLKRSEPEGFRETTVADMLPLKVPLQSDQKDSKVGAGFKATTSGLLGNVTYAVGGLEKAIDSTSVSYIKTEEAAESDDSSADSLAVRVSSLLKKDAPLSCRSATRASMQLKLADHSTNPVTYLSEEDRKRIAEIKRDLLEGAKESQQVKNLYRTDAVQARPYQWKDNNPFVLHLTPSPGSIQSGHVIYLDSKKSGPKLSAPPTGDRTYGKHGDLTVPSFKGASPVSQSLDKSNVPQAMQVSVKSETKEFSNELPSVLQQPSEEWYRPITSITFSSHRRSPHSFSSGSEPTSPGETSSVHPLSFNAVAPTELSQSLTGNESSVTNKGMSSMNYQHGTGSQTIPKEVDGRPELSEGRLIGLVQTRQLPVQNLDLANKLSSTDDVKNRPSVTDLSIVTSLPLLPGITNSNRNDFKAEGAQSGALGQTVQTIVTDRQRECSPGVSREKIHQQQLSSPHGPTPTTPPTKRALSCVHVKLSPKQDTKEIKLVLVPDASVHSTVPTPNKDPPSCNFQVEGTELSLSGEDNLFRLQNLANENQTFPDPFLHEAIGPFKLSEDCIRPVTARIMAPKGAADISQDRTELSDAATQITTESPEKTTFSAEIFLDGKGKDTISSCKTPDRQPAYPAKLTQATDQPLLVPYRPHGSPEFFYVPYVDGLSRISPVSTMESSRTGSSDAFSPNFPAGVLGSAVDSTSDSSILRHKEGIYSKDTSPKLAWMETTSTHKKTLSGDPPKRSAERDGQIQLGSYIKTPNAAFRQEGSPSLWESRSHNVRNFMASYQGEKNSFFHLEPELDNSSNDGTDSYGSLGGKDSAEDSLSTSLQKTDTSGCRAVSGQDGNLRLVDSPLVDISERKQGKPYTDGQYIPVRQDSQHLKNKLNLTTASNQSLDDLWARFTNRKKNQLSESTSNLEMSLVERLDRLARLLQKPSSHSMGLSNDDQLPGGEYIKTGKYIIKQSRGEKQERWHDGKHPGSRNCAVREESEGSDIYPAERSVETESAPSEIDTATQTGSEGTTQTGETNSVLTLNTVSSSVSTIDTVRLIKAFGPDRVCPSSRLSRLYNTIDLQKKRTEEGTRKYSRSSARKMDLNELHRSVRKGTESISTMSTSSGSCKPMSTTGNHKSNKRLHKGIQAGDLEIVTSATKRHTRDVGTIFPSPRGQPQMSPLHGNIQKEGIRWDKDSFNHWGRYNRQIPVKAGLSWFVPAEDLKSDSRKENRSDLGNEPSVTWYKPLISTKPWREPLREKNIEMQLKGRDSGRINGSYPDSSPDNTLKTLVKVTLQESLKTHRPDFIFHSGQRMRRLHLITEERKLQAEFQSEREKLFNQPLKSTGQDREQQILDQKIRKIPKKEMVQRSRRIYEQLPEVKKKKEDEKRRSEYESYRHKAQLFKKKVTNHVLGRKTPWN
ncbi:hypothetical protein GDO86_000023 [Hymenochirus boettgeri]|uniref:ALMS motif domain-containing protein n=1 Tax=Hymenochirus boettgeri TaxID=247094 RepID=A0A8T2KAF2_9PIPI|nr:hypothetical protein GDO86_000023 [Hymenochirus boettgeri]